MIRNSSNSMRLGPAESQWHDVLRLVLLLQVVLGHTAAIALPGIPQLTGDFANTWPCCMFRLVWRFGPQAAYLFVFLSGYMVAGPLLNSAWEGRVPLAREFFIGRLRRIMPISVAAVLLTALVDALSRMSPGAEALYRHSYSYDMVSTYTLGDFVGNVLCLQPILVRTFGSNGPLWTLGYITQYYAAGWLICKVFARSRSLGILALTAGVLSMWLLHAEWSVLLLSWLFGGVARTLKVPERLSKLFLPIGLILFVLSNLVSPLASAALSIPVGFMLTAAFRHLPEVRRLSGNSGLRRLSNDSFVIYAVHHPVLMSIFAVAFSGSAGANIRFFLFVATSIVAAIALGAIVNTLVNSLPVHGNRKSKARQICRIHKSPFS